MLKRQPLNTLTLQKKFPKVYRDFFADCQRVASASNSFLWTGEFAGFYGGLTVSQKLPIRSYVGFETTFDHEVAVSREYLTFQADTGEFATHLLDDRLATNLEGYIRAHYAPAADFTGLRVHLLTEIPLGHSLGSNGAIAAALALLLTGEGNIKKTFQTAREVLSLSQAGHSSGVSAYVALADEHSPIVFSSHNESYFAKSIHQLAKLRTPAAWPIDFGLIFSGGGANAESVILANNQTILELDQETNELNKLLDGSQKLNFRRTYIDMLNMAASLTIHSLVELFRQGSKNAILERLFSSLNQYQNLLHLVHVADGASDIIYGRLHQLANKQFNDVGSGVKLSGIGKGGAMLFAVPYGHHRAEILELVEQLKQETSRPIWLDYASWLDGIGGEPGKIEQDIAAGRRSPFVDHDSLIMLLLNQGKVRHLVLTNDRFTNFQKEVDLLVDKTTGKILIAGHSLTSKELPSQKATVTIIAALIKANKFRLRNDEIAASYGSSRYDLQGKIVMPLIKQVKDLTGRDLQLSVHGGMYDNYELSLDPMNIVIGVIEKKI